MLTYRNYSIPPFVYDASYSLQFKYQYECPACRPRSRSACKGIPDKLPYKDAIR